MCATTEEVNLIVTGIVFPELFSVMAIILNYEKENIFFSLLYIPERRMWQRREMSIISFQ